MTLKPLLILGGALALSGFSTGVSAQSDVALSTRSSELQALARSLKARDAEQRQQVAAAAKRMGIATRRELSRGRVVEWQRIAPGIGPIFYVTNNVDAADTVSTDEVWPGGSAGLALEGSGFTIGEWDGGAVYAEHPDLIGRVNQVDGSSLVSEHSTHVAGTLIGAGANPFYPMARGMAYAADLDAHDWNSDTAEMALAAADGMLVSNHSYGIAAGWLYLGDEPPDTWWWIGGADPADVEDINFGYYDAQAQLWDQIAWDAPYYLIVKAGGNDRWDTGPLPGEEYTVIDQDGNFLFTSTLPRDADCAPAGYDCLPGNSVAKNILTIGAVDDLTDGYAPLAGPSQVQMAGFSGWGPTDDGRIKPDLVGNGIWLVSTWPAEPGYAAALGTSMATPNVSGSLLLLQEHYEDINGAGNFMRSATLKALAIHTADEAGGADGPDYAFGWGLLNTARAAEVITGDVGYHQIIEETLVDGAEDLVEIIVTEPDSVVRITLAWTDPPGTPIAPVLDAPDRMLVNDLDLRLTRGPSSWLPWVLDPSDPAAPATTGDNVRDNVEQVVAEVSNTGSYYIEVGHKGALQGGSQDYALIVSISPAPPSGFGTLIDEGFADGLPAGWAVETVRGVDWTVQSPVPGDQNLDNHTGGSGPFAIVNSDFSNTLTSLILPTLDLSTASGVILSFDSSMLFSDWETINVDVSTDGGSNWSNVWYKAGLIGLPHHYVLDLSGTLAGQSAAAMRFRYNTFNGPMGYYWQIDNVKLDALGGGTPTPVAPGPATDPFPADDETGVGVETIINWSAGSDAETHDVYFDTVSPPAFVGNFGGTGFDPGPLAYDTTYYWRVDEVNDAGTTIGSVWSFTTEAGLSVMTDIHLAEMTGGAIPGARNRWTASVQVDVADTDLEPVANVLVEGAWSGGANGGGTCTTDETGRCVVEKGNLKANVTSVEFTVASLSGTDMRYDPTANTVPVMLTVFQDGGGDLQPVARNDLFSTPQDTPLSGNVMDNDDPGDAPAVVSGYDGSSAQGGLVEVPDPATGEFDYTPPGGFTGTDSFTYTISDIDGDSDSATVSISVEPVGGGGEALSVTSIRDRGEWYADLTWSGFNTADVAIYLNGGELDTVSNTGSYTYPLGKKPNGVFVFRVCEPDNDPCAADSIQF